MNDNNTNANANIESSNKLLVIEGVDGSGKTWVIDNLIKKYPDNFVRFPFPTYTGKIQLQEKLKTIDMTNFQDVMDYHFLFIKDIMDHQPLLTEKLAKGNHHIVLDRYYFSTICYLKNNIRKIMKDHKNFAVKWDTFKEEILYKMLIQCKLPDNVILLVNNFKEKDTDLMFNSHSDLQNINQFYKDEILYFDSYIRMKYQSKSFNYVEVESFSDTMFIIEDYIQAFKFVKQKNQT